MGWGDVPIAVTGKVLSYFVIASVALSVVSKAVIVAYDVLDRGMLLEDAAIKLVCDFEIWGRWSAPSLIAGAMCRDCRSLGSQVERVIREGQECDDLVFGKDEDAWL